MAHGDVLCARLTHREASRGHDSQVDLACMPLRDGLHKGWPDLTLQAIVLAVVRPLAPSDNIIRILYLVRS